MSDTYSQQGVHTEHTTASLHNMLTRSQTRQDAATLTSDLVYTDTLPTADLDTGLDIPATGLNALAAAAQATLVLGRIVIRL